MQWCMIPIFQEDSTLALIRNLIQNQTLGGIFAGIRIGISFSLKSELESNIFGTAHHWWTPVTRGAQNLTIIVRYSQRESRAHVPYFTTIAHHLHSSRLLNNTIMRVGLNDFVFFLFHYITKAICYLWYEYQGSSIKVTKVASYLAFLLLMTWMNKLHCSVDLYGPTMQCPRTHNSRTEPWPWESLANPDHAKRVEP